MPVASSLRSCGAPPFERSHRENFDRPNNRPIGFPQWLHSHSDRDPTSLLVPKENMRLVRAAVINTPAPNFPSEARAPSYNALQVLLISALKKIASLRDFVAIIFFISMTCTVWRKTFHPRSPPTI